MTLIRFAALAPLILAVLSSNAAALDAAAVQTATVTDVSGDVEIFSHPSTHEALGPPPHAFFEGLNYSVKAATVGARIDEYNLVRTGPHARCRLIYANGDQVIMGAGSAYRPSWTAKETSQPPSVLRLLYGKLRLIIQSHGPRSGMKVETSTVAMGVRGTDFFVSHDVAQGTDLVVVRGSVEMAPVPASPAAAPVAATKVVPGEIGRVQVTASDAPVPAKVEIRPVSKQDLATVEHSTQIQPVAAPQPVSVEIAAEVADLKTRATTVTLKDIQREDPQLYARIEKQADKAPEVLSAMAVEKLAEKSADTSAVKLIEIAGQETKKEEATNQLKSRPEDWYLRLGVALAATSYSSHELSDAISRSQNYNGGSDPSPTAELGVLWPLANQQTALGFSLMGGAQKSGGGDNSVEVKHWDLTASLARFYGTNVGHGWFLRGDAGLSRVNVRVDQNIYNGPNQSGPAGPSTLYSTHSDDTKMGLTFYFGGGYSWPVLYGTRLIFGATAQLRLVKDSTMYGIGPTLGILF